MQLKNIIKGKTAGEEIEIGEECEGSGNQTLKSRIIAFMKRYRWTIFFWVQDAVWGLKRWKNPKLETFVKNCDPDIIFTVLTNSVCLNNLILHIRLISGAKLILYAWDNNYSLKQVMVSPLRWIKHLIDRSSMRKLTQAADKLYVISRIQQQDYEKCFRRPCKLLTKGADFEEAPEFKTENNEILQLVFTGNIGLNRWKSLKVIADALENINCAGIKLQLRIYTATPVTKKMERALNRGESSFLMGSVPASRVPELQKEADILVHVEAFDLKNKLTVRQSFSTKIVDYLKAARPILAVGPKDVASIDHLIKNNCAIVADNRRELEEKLRSVIADKTKLRAIARNGYACGRRYHNKQDIQTMLMNDLNAICGK
jgi:glycosyltransferase involved in cell wall biosynthesis